MHKAFAIKWGPNNDPAILHAWATEFPMGSGHYTGKVSALDEKTQKTVLAAIGPVQSVNADDSWAAQISYDEINSGQVQYEKDPATTSIIVNSTAVVVNGANIGNNTFPVPQAAI
jgi:hypothetical protein